MSVIETKVKPVTNTKDNTTVIPNKKFPDKPSLIKDKFFNYDIYHVCIDGVEMYAVTEILKQYADHYGKKRIIIQHYLELENTKNYINILYEIYVNKLKSQNSCEIQDKNKMPEDARDHEHLQNNSNDLKIHTNVENNDKDANINSSNNYYDDKPGVILRFSFDGYDIVNVKETTLMCEKLLTHCLMWLDINFANDVFNFIERLRHQDNDFLKHNLEIVEIENNELKLMTQKQTQLISQLISDIQSKNDELESIITELHFKSKESVKTNCMLMFKINQVERFDNKSMIKREELNKINSEINSKNNYLHRINSNLNSKITELTKLDEEIESKTNYFNQVKTEYEDKYSELENKLDELESLNENINQAKLELERLTQALKNCIACFEPRQMIDTCKTNWTLYFTKRNLFLKNGRSLYIHVSFGYRNQRDIPKIIKDNIIYCIKNCPNGQVSRQGIVKQVYEYLRHRHAESCNCKENECYKYLNTVEFRLDLFCTKSSFNDYKQRIRDALDTNNEVALAEYLLCLTPKVTILKTLEDLCEDIVKTNNWYNSSCQYHY